LQANASSSSSSSMFLSKRQAVKMTTPLSSLSRQFLPPPNRYQMLHPNWSWPNLHLAWSNNIQHPWSSPFFFSATGITNVRLIRAKDLITHGQ
jgi:hypothetical protein